MSAARIAGNSSPEAILSDFKGNSVVIGCGHAYYKDSPNKHRCQKAHGDAKEFLLIDSNKDAKPDLVFNITDNLPPALCNRFELTIMEGLPFFAYSNDEDFCVEAKGGQQGFKNAWDMTKNNGILLIAGCSRTKTFRKNIYDFKLKYLELDNSTIIIPKDQTINITDLENKIKDSKLLCNVIEVYLNLRYDAQLRQYPSLYQHISKKIFSYCELSYESLPNWKETQFSKTYSLKKMESKDCEKHDKEIFFKSPARDTFFSKIIIDMLNNVPCPAIWDNDSIATIARHGKWKELLRDKLIEIANQSEDPIDVINKALTRTHTALYKIFACRRGFGRIKTLFFSPENSQADGVISYLKKEKWRMYQQMRNPFIDDDTSDSAHAQRPLIPLRDLG